MKQVLRSLFATFIVLCVTTPQISAQFTTNDWRQIGAGGGGVMCSVAFDPNDSDKIYVGTDITGVFRTSDGGVTWDASVRGLSSYYIFDIVVHPTNSNVIYVATKQGISRSVDGGETWHTVHENVNETSDDSEKYATGFNSVVVDPVESNVMWATVGTFRSEAGNDGGDHDDQFAAVYRSTAFGEPGTWDPVPGPADDFGVHNILPLNANTNPFHAGTEKLFIAGTNGIYLATHHNGDWIWEPRNGHYKYGLPHTDCREIAANYDASGQVERLYVVLNTYWDEVDSTSVYNHAAGYGGGIWYSDNLGGTWYPTSFADGSDGFELEFGRRYTGEPKNMRHVAVDQENGDIYTGLHCADWQSAGVYRGRYDSEDGWQWVRMTEQRYVPEYNMEPTYMRSLPGCHGLGIDQNSGDVLFTTSMQAWRCPDGNCEPGGDDVDIWEALHCDVVSLSPISTTTTGMDATQAWDITVSPSNPDVWFMALSDLGLMRSDDAGASWRMALSDTMGIRDTYGNYNCRKILSIPGSTNHEYLGIFGNWNPSTMLEVWYTVGDPDTDSYWKRVDLANSSTQVEDIVFLDNTYGAILTGDGLLGAVNSGGTLWNWEWMAGIDTSTTSSEITDLAIGPGTGANRPFVASFKREDRNHLGAVFYTNTFCGPWTEASCPTCSPDYTRNVYSATWSATDPDVVYAGTGAAAFWGSEMASVLVSYNRGVTWEVHSTHFGSNSRDCINVVDIVVTGTDMYAALGLIGRSGRYYPLCYPQSFAGVYRWDTSGEEDQWVDASYGLDMGAMLFLKQDESDPTRLFTGSIGNGAAWLDLTAGGGPGLLNKPGHVVAAGTSLRLASANPASMGAEIAFQLPEPNAVTLQIYDLSGRVVRTLMRDDQHRAGPHQVSWDGRDDAGQRAATGAYFVRLTLPEERLDERLILFR